MWYLFACVATPMSASCITPVAVQSEAECKVLEERWRGTAQVTHDRANVRTQCAQVDGQAAVGQVPSMNLGVPRIGK